jgi:hypothetical protein
MTNDVLILLKNELPASNNIKRLPIKRSLLDESFAALDLV